MTTLTTEQRRIVEWGEGPAVVIAGAGTGKTRVIVERVRHLLDQGGVGASATDPGAPATTRAPVLPEQILVLTYNVKAAAELRARLEQAVGLATAARMEIGNFHSFCQGILTDHAGDAGLPARPDVLDGVGQLLLLRDIAPDLDLVYHGTSTWTLANIVNLINRCKDELVTPAAFQAFVAQERRTFEGRYGAFDAAADRLATQGNLRPIRDVRSAYASLRAHERAEERGETRTYKPNMVETAADREARRTLAGDGTAPRRNQFPPEAHAAIDALADTYVRDAAALEVLHLTELHRVFQAYEFELAKRGALDYGEQIAGVAQLFKTRPNVLRDYQRQYRYLPIDEFQDANVAQIEIIELLGRSPDRPDNVMVVGDDDQSIYRFRGASFAAFAEFERRFAQPPVHDRTAPPPGPPPRLRLEQNFRSDGHVLTGANRLIAMNATRFVPDKRLVTDHPDGEPIAIVVCSSPEDEAVAIVDLIKGLDAGTPLTDVAILYRKHKHRDAIVARLRDEDIPYTVVGGLSLFATPEIRDLEQGLRAIADPEDDAAFVRMLTAGPWRLDAIDILRITRMAAFDKRHLIDAVAEIVDAGQVEVDRVGETTAEGRPAHEAVDADARLRGRLRLVRDTISELNPLTYREGPHTILERYLERTGQVLDLIATDTRDAKRTVTNIASFVRFAADWQRANPMGTLGGFVDYLDAYQGAGGELPTSVELSEDTEGVRLMTLYQAKGLEFPIVIVPQLLDGEWPTREAVPVGDLHTDEERRLLYVAMTRAQRRLVLTTQGSVSASRGGSSQFIGEVAGLRGGGDDIQLVDRTPGGATTAFRAGAAVAVAAAAADDDDVPLDLGLDAIAPLPEPVSDLDRLVADVRRVMPLPTARERRLALRLRASELVGLMESTDARDPEAAGARAAYTDELAATGRAAALDADVAREQGLDPLSLRVVALDSGAGANLLQVAPLPGTHSYTSLNAYERCPLQYAFSYVYRMPARAETSPWLTFGGTAHQAFEAFTKERRERVARGEPPPTREDLEREFRSRWKPTAFGDQATEAGYARRVSTLLDNFWEGELATLGEAIREEEDFELRLDPGEGLDPVMIRGSIDRIDRLPGGGLEVIDYKTGKVGSQKGVDESLQLSIYALACRDALDLGTPERATLYFTESATRLSTTRTDEQLDAARADVLERVSRMRDGESTATPSADACRYCDYRAMCPERV